MTDYDVCPEGGTWQPGDHPTFSDRIDDMERAYRDWCADRIDDGKFARLVGDFLHDAREADRELREYR